jgi:hypothetical protein
VENANGKRFFVVLLLDRPFCRILILVDNVKDVQHCVRHPVWGCHAHFP